jgi:hypothetical protein
MLIVRLFEVCRGPRVPLFVMTHDKDKRKFANGEVAGQDGGRVHWVYRAVHAPHLTNRRQSVAHVGHRHSVHGRGV